jgi:hypothetical protein
MSGTMVVEVAPFAVADGVPEASLLEVSERLEREFLARSEGYLGRVEAAMRRVDESPACSAYFTCMAGVNYGDPGQGVSLFRAVRVYGSLAT